MRVCWLPVDDTDDRPARIEVPQLISDPEMIEM
jgi:hypothetical protein